jgi:hypothetical protein
VGLCERAHDVEAQTEPSVVGRRHGALEQVEQEGQAPARNADAVVARPAPFAERAFIAAVVMGTNRVITRSAVQALAATPPPKAPPGS